MTGTMVDAHVAGYFASPALGADPIMPRALVGEYARGLIQIACEYCHSFLIDFNPSILPALSALTADTLPWSVAWTPALARIEAYLAHSTPAAVMWDVLGPLVITAAVEGLLPEFDLRLQTPQAVQWSHLKLPRGDRIHCQRTSEGAAVRIEDSGVHQRSLILKRSTEGVWHADDDVESLSMVWLGETPIPLHAELENPRYPVPSGRSVLRNAGPQTAPVFNEAGQFLSTYSPYFVAWVAGAIRNIVPLDGSDGVRMSASVEEFPALTFMSFPAPAVEIAETLAHESSHHYYFALQRLTPLHDGSDRKEYYSPIKNRGRTIDLILFAFHAFGNAALFHRDLVRGGETQFYSLNGRTLDVSLDRLRVMHEHLCETRALTEAGITLWKPLAERLFEG